MYKEPFKKGCKMGLVEISFKGSPLNQEQSNNFLHLLMAPEKERPLEDSEIRNEFLAQILLKRIDAYNLPFIITDYFFVMSVSTFVDRPGLAILLLRLCWQEWKKNGTTKFDLNIWGTKLFPFGVPTEEELEAMWDSQKGFNNNSNVDNLLDLSDNWS